MSAAAKKDHDTDPDAKASGKAAKAAGKHAKANGQHAHGKGHKTP